MSDEISQQASSPDSPPPRTTGGKWRWEPPAPEELQKLMPGYTIEKLLGRGGMGAVYRGIQINLDRPVAIKILPPGVEKEDPSFAERFKSEAKLMARLNHPAVVAVYDFGTTQGGQLYFAMEYVDGSDVAQMIAAQGKLPPEHALAITAHVCDALSAAHELGIVHRDIKPANVLINMKGQVKVADFGLAKVEEPGQHGFTKTGYAMGTPDFVAPEALMLGTGVDGRADLYAVGVMLYQMLTGNIPRGAFKPASQLVPGLDPRFDAIIIKAMQHERTERHQSAAELRRELDVILTVPLVQTNAPASAAIPVAQVAAQRSAAQRPTDGPPRSAGTPARAAAPKTEAGKSSRAPLFLGLGTAAALGIGAFVMLGSGSRETSPASNAPAKGTLTSSSTNGGSAPASSGSRETSNTAPPKTTPPSPKPGTLTSPATVTKPSEPQFPPGKWVKVFTKLEDLPENLRKSDSGVKFEDGWIRFPTDKSNRIYAVNNLTNYGIRAKFLRLTDATRGSTLVIRAALPPHNAGYLLSPAKGDLYAARRLEGEAGVVERFWSVSSPTISLPKSGDEYTLEWCCVGNKLIARFNERFVKVVTDNTFSSGPGYFTGNTDLRDIEVINLDGLSEAEALKILGVDEKGNDLRRAAVASRAAGPPAAASVPAMSKAENAPATPNTAPGGPSALPTTQFPPGKWVRVFDNLEEMKNAGVTAKDKEISQKDGWFVPSISPIDLRLHGHTGTNLGIRAKFKATPERISFDLTSDSSNHRFTFHQASAKVGMTMLEHEPSDATLVKELLAQKTVIPQEPSDSIIEYGHVEGRYIGRLNGKLEFVLPSLKRSNVRPSIYYSGAFRDIEVINLDGLPESEALRLLGVDEKGNDLRTLAAQQEQQMAEQAKTLDAMAAIPELKALHEQFMKLQAERVTAPFEAEVEKLNAGYGGGIDRKIAEEKQAGHLDGVLALEEEKKLIQGVTGSLRGSATSRQPSDTRRQDAVAPCPLPADTDTTPATLKALRQIYREAHAKLEATRAANLKLLTDPLDARLKQLETQLTRQDRVDHAKTVREYREGLGRAAGPPAAASGPPSADPPKAALGGPSALPAKKFPPGDDRKAAEWVLEKGGTVMIREGGRAITVTKLDSLPKGRFVLASVSLEFSATKQPKSAIADLTPLARLEELSALYINSIPIGDAAFDIIPSLPKLDRFRAQSVDLTDDVFAHFNGANLSAFGVLGCGRVKGEKISALRNSKNLTHLTMQSCGLTAEGIREIARLPSIKELNISASKVGDEVLPLLASLTKLTQFSARRTAFTAEALTAIKAWRDLLTLEVDIRPGEMAAESLRLSKAFPKLEEFGFQGDANWQYTAEDLRGLEALSNLRSLVIWNSNLGDAAVDGLLDLDKLESLRFGNGSELTDNSLTSLTKLSNLRRIDISTSPKITVAGVEAFKKKRPDVTVTR